MLGTGAPHRQLVAVVCLGWQHVDAEALWRWRHLLYLKEPRLLRPFRLLFPLVLGPQEHCIAAWCSRVVPAASTAASNG